MCETLPEKNIEIKRLKSDPKGLRHRNEGTEEGHISQRSSGNLVG